MKTNAAVVGGGRFEPPEAAQVAGVWSTVSPANDWRVLAPRLCVMMFLVSMPSSTKYVLPIVSKATLLMTRRSARVRARSVSNLPAPAPGGRARTARSNQVRWVSLTVRRAGRDVGRYVVVRVYVPDYGVGGHTGVSDEL